MASPFPSVAGEPSVVVVRILDGNGGNVHLALTGPNGRKEQREFKAPGCLGTKGLLGNLQAASQGYQEVTEKLYKESYALKSTLLNPTANLTTLVFIKPG
ncbi:hypothetical protein [Hymenobacter bucti]|uniref:Uncharacterized protein n=1 Tax=Hymenobacter bucti TaxID=1844114 RepID=A0ABW4QZA4_9BACT